MRETEVWRPYQLAPSSLQSRTMSCSKLEMGTESPGLDLRTSRTVCGCDKALQPVVSELRIVRAVPEIILVGGLQKFSCPKDTWG